MIEDRKTYEQYLQADRRNMIPKNRLWDRWCDVRWAYVRTLRRAEFVKNCGRGPLMKLVLACLLHRLERLGERTGYTIPLNVFGPGISLPHRGTIVVNSKTRAGANCRIHVCVNIGASAGSKDAPKIGDNVYIGPGAKLFGGIEIADGIAVAANAVVTKSFTEAGITIAGVPAQKISDGGAAGAGWRPEEE